jgi:hypothetical protein
MELVNRSQDRNSNSVPPEYEVPTNRSQCSVSELGDERKYPAPIENETLVFRRLTTARSVTEFI